MKEYTVKIRGVKLYVVAGIDGNDVEIGDITPVHGDDTITDLVSAKVEEEIQEAIRQQDAEERAELRQTKGEYL